MFLVGFILCHPLPPCLLLGTFFSFDYIFDFTALRIFIIAAFKKLILISESDFGNILY